MAVNAPSADVRKSLNKILKGGPATDYRVNPYLQPSPARTQVPDYFSNRKLAGEKHPDAKGSTVDRVHRIYDGVYDTAKAIHLSQENKLPWEYDTKGKLLSTELDVLKFKINYLKELMQIDKDEWKVNADKAFGNITADDVRVALINASAQQLIPLEMEHAQIKAESNFRQNLINWMLGEGSSDEYKKCWWIRIHPPDADKDKTLAKLYDEGKKDLANALAKERKKLLDGIPGFTRGVIEHTDKLPIRSKEFLEELARNAPKTDEGKKNMYLSIYTL
jgi:hypothetical protein